MTSPAPLGLVLSGGILDCVEGPGLAAPKCCLTPPDAGECRSSGSVLAARPCCINMTKCTRIIVI